MVKYKVKVFSVLTFLLLIVAGCSSEDKIATINGEDITKQQFQAYLEFKRIQVRDEKHRETLLEQFLEREALSQVISEQEAFDKLAAQAELDEFERQMNISRYFDRYLKDAVTDDKIKNYYVANESQYQEQKVHVAHVLFRLKKGMTEDQRKAVLTRANEAYSKIRANEPFEKVVENYSEDRVSAKKAGDLGWLKQGAIDTKFSSKVFAMKKDEISEPFETSFGYHIVKILDEPRTIKKPFEAVKGDIRYQLRQRAKEAELKALKQQIKISRKD